MADETTIEGLQAQLTAAQARIKEVSDEAKGHRLNATEARKATEVAETARATAETASAERIKQIETDAGAKLSKAQQSAVRANLRVAAKEAGAADPNDMLALIAPERLVVNEDGEIENAAELMTELKKAKPYLFGAASTSSTSTPPETKPPVPQLATDMTDAEYKAARAAVTRR